jgi:hypothetical protein
MLSPCLATQLGLEHPRGLLADARHWQPRGLQCHWANNLAGTARAIADRLAAGAPLTASNRSITGRESNV